MSRDPVGVSGALNADDQHRAMLGQTKKYLPDFKQHEVKNSLNVKEFEDFSSQFGSSSVQHGRNWEIPF